MDSRLSGLERSIIFLGVSIRYRKKIEKKKFIVMREIFRREIRCEKVA